MFPKHIKEGYAISKSVDRWLYKALPRVHSSLVFAHWITIFLLDELYEIFHKALANRLQKYLASLINCAQYDSFWAGGYFLTSCLCSS